MTKLYLDFESRSHLSLEDVGLDNYAKHPSTEVTMLGWAFDDDPVQLWEPRLGPMPSEILEALVLDIDLLAWNAGFERNIFKYVLKKDIPYERWFDIMVAARHLSLPGSLASCGNVLGLSEEEAKIKDGKRLIQKFCKPFKMGGEITLFGVTEPEYHDWNTSPEDWNKFKEYCKRDVETERTIFKKINQITPLPESERHFWCLDQKINDAGMPINIQFVNNALELATRSKQELDEALKLKTGLENPNSRDQMLEWATKQGYPHTSLGKDFVSAAIASKSASITDLCREVLKLRQKASKTSYRKFETIKDMVSADGFLRNQFMFMGASRTGRWSSSGGVQVHNLPKPIKEVEKRYDLAVELITANDYDGIKNKFSSVTDVVVSCVRSAFQAPKGYELAVCDLGAIETRVGGWMAGCDAILDVFRKGLDPYVSFATKMYNKSYEELVNDKEKRQIAKAPMLGCIFGLGPGVERKGKYYTAILKQDAYGNTVKTGLLGYAERMGIILTPEQAYIAWETFRSAYPEVVQYWYAMENAAINVLLVHEPMSIIAGPISFDKVLFENQQILRMKLPSGRYLHYMNARVGLQEAISKRGKPYEKQVIMYDGIGHGIGAVNKTQKWDTVYTRGAKLLENGDQAISRDILLHGMQLADLRRIHLTGHFHDEIMALVNKNDPFAAGFDELKNCMITVPKWAPGLILGADGWVGKVYKKG